MNKRLKPTYVLISQALQGCIFEKNTQEEGGAFWGKNMKITKYGEIHFNLPITRGFLG